MVYAYSINTIFYIKKHDKLYINDQNSEEILDL